MMPHTRPLLRLGRLLEVAQVLEDRERAEGLVEAIEVEAGDELRLDELLAELEEMTTGANGGGGSGDGDDEEDAAEDEAVRAARDAEEIERRDRAWREAEATRARMPKVPSSRTGKGKGKATEKQVLLSGE